MKKHALYINFNIDFRASDGGQLESLEKIKFLAKHYNLTILNIISDIRLINGDWKKGSDNLRIKFLEVYSPELNLKKIQKIIQGLKIIFSPFPRLFFHLNKKSLSSITLEPDIIFYGYLPTISIGKLLKIRNLPETVYFAQNVEFELVSLDTNSILKKFFNYSQKLKTKLFEQTYLKQVDKVIAFTKSDKVKLEKLTLRNDIFVVPPIITFKGGWKGDSANTVLITTNLEHQPNLESINWFLKNVYQYIDKNIQILITGKDKNDFLKNIKFSNIKYLGFIPRNELEKLYLSVKAVLNPTISGGGFQMKLLDALSYGTPVVSTKFSNHFDNKIESSDDPMNFAEIVNNLCTTKLITPFDFKKQTQEHEKLLCRVLGIETKIS